MRTRHGAPHCIKSFFSEAGAETVRVERFPWLPNFDTFPDVDRRRTLGVHACYGLVPRRNAQGAT